VRTLILAAGPDDGWEAPFPKQLCPIAGEPLLLNTLRKFAGAVVVTNKPEIEALGVKCFRPACTATIFDTILSTRGLWQGKVLVLSGDFYYREDMRAEILEYKGETPALFGDHSLLFAKKDYEAVEQILKDLAAVGPSGDLFNRLRLTAGIPRVSEVEADLDFDIWPYYQQFLEANPWAR
jgi:hypothetical protein